MKDKKDSENISEVEEKYEETCDEESATTEQKIEEVPDFITFISSLSANALYNMGLMNTPISEKAKKNMSLARYTIDIIAMLKEKTMGNLTKEEQRFVDSLLYDLKLKFVNLCKT